MAAHDDDQFRILPLPGSQDDPAATIVSPREPAPLRPGDSMIGLSGESEPEGRAPDPAPEAEVRPQFALARAMVLFGLGTAAGAVALMAGGILPPAALLACLPLVLGMGLGLVGCYQSDPQLSRQGELAREADELSAQLHELAEERQRRAGLCRDLESEMKRDRSQLIARRNALENEGRRRQAQIRAGYDETKRQLLRRLQAMCETTDRELKQLDQQRHEIERHYQTELASLADQGEREASGIIGEMQRKYIHLHLANTRVNREELPDLKEEILAQLIFMGITRAIDISFDRLAAVPGLGTLETLALCGWRTRHEERARAEGPHELPPEDTHAILTRYHEYKKHLEAERHAAMGRISHAEQAIRTRRKSETLALEAQLAAARKSARHAWREINEEYAARFHSDAAVWLDGSSERRERYRRAAASETEMALDLADGRQRLGEIEVERARLAQWTLGAYLRGVFFLPVRRDGEGAAPIRSTPTLLRAEATMVLAFADAFEKRQSLEGRGVRRAA